MDYLLWIGLFLLGSLLWAWIILWGGAEWLEGSFLVGLLVHFRAPARAADGIRIFAWGTWLVQAVWFLLGLFSRDVRRFWL